MRENPLFVSEEKDAGGARPLGGGSRCRSMIADNEW